MKQRSPRKKNMTLAWSKMVYSKAGISDPDKKTRKLVQTFWYDGFSHKDTAIHLIESAKDGDA